MNYKILMYVTVVLITINGSLEFFTSFWVVTRYSDLINSILGIFLILFGTQVFFKKIKKSKEV